MLSYRFNENCTDYIIFLYQDMIEVDVVVKSNLVETQTYYYFTIINKTIKWYQIPDEIISIKCQAFCQKLVNLVAFL